MMTAITRDDSCDLVPVFLMVFSLFVIVEAFGLCTIE